MSIFVILTIPHSYCKSNTDYIRTCDRRAEESASKLAFHLKTFGIPFILFKSDTERSEWDLNRIESRELDWRKKLRKIVNDSYKKYDYIILLDIHSYPDNAFADSVKSKAYNAKIVMLLGSNILAKYLKNNIKDITKVAILQGSWKNDIMLEFEDIAECLLIEFNENKNKLSSSLLDEITYKISEAIYNLL